MALGSEVNDNSSKTTSQKVKKIPAAGTVNDKSGDENVTKGKFIWSCL